MKNERIKQQAVKAINRSIHAALLPHAGKRGLIDRLKNNLKPGNALETVLKLASITPRQKKCGCASVKQKMNFYGWKWVFKNRKSLISHLAAEAGKIGIKASPSIPSLARAYVSTLIGITHRRPEDAAEMKHQTGQHKKHIPD